MDRRTFLSRAAAGATAGLAGCAGLFPDGEEPPTTARTTTREATTTRTATTARTTVSGPTAPGDLDLPVSTDRLTLGGFKDSVPAITEPEFADDWSDLEVEINRDGITEEFQFDLTPRLDPDERVIGVERAGEARAYPVAVLDWHEIVNDRLGGPLLVTYCPLCGSAVVAHRVAGGEPTTFGVSGLLLDSNLVLYDEATRSLWSQLRAQAIRGPLTGERLSLLPSTLTTWAAWQEAHPDTRVLLPPPRSGTVAGRVARDSRQDPYPNYENTSYVGIGGNRGVDDRLHPKTLVVGVTADGRSRAYPIDAVRGAGVVNDAVGDLPVAVVADSTGTFVAYDRRVDGRAVAFEAAGDGVIRGGGSRWAVVTGRALDGPHEGRTLRQANDRSPMFWFAWADFNPETEIYGPG